MKAAIYEQLGLKVTYLPGQEKIRADVTISPEKFLEHTDPDRPGCVRHEVAGEPADRQFRNLFQGG